MISINALEAAHGINTNGLVLSPISGTPLAVISRALIDKTIAHGYLVGNVDDSDKSIDEIITTIHQLSDESETSYESHEVELNELMKRLMLNVKTNIYLTRNVVLPLVDRYTEKLNNIVNTHQLANGIALNVVDDRRVFILQHPNIIQLTERHSERTNYEVDLPRYHEDISGPELLAALRTGNKGLDDDIADWVTLNDLSSTVYSVFKNLYLKGDSNLPLTRYVNSDNPTEALIGFLLGLGLPKLKIMAEGVGLQKYEADMEAAASACAGLVNQAIKEHTLAIKRKRLVLSYPAPGRATSFDTVNNVLINRTVYDEFLERGGEVELIFGAYLTDRETDLEAILGNPTKYLDAYNRLVSQNKLTRQNKVLTAVKNGLFDLQLDICKDIDDLQDGDVETSVGRIQLLVENVEYDVNNYVRRLDFDSIENLYTLVRHFICTIFFKDSAVYDILQRMDQLGKENDNINDVAIYASVDYMVSWLMSQVTTGTDESI